MSYSSVQALLKTGVSRPTMYQVIIPRIGIESNRQIELLCKATRVPEMAVTTINANGQDAQGVVRQSPAHLTFSQPFSCTIISDREYTVYKAVKAWMSSITTNGNPLSGGAGAAQKADYYNSITETITLIKLENNGGGTVMSPFKVNFNNAYPVRIGDLTLGSDQYNTFMEFQVDFYYETYTFVE